MAAAKCRPRGLVACDKRRGKRRGDIHVARVAGACMRAVVLPPCGRPGVTSGAPTCGANRRKGNVSSSRGTTETCGNEPSMMARVRRYSGRPGWRPALTARTGAKETCRRPVAQWKRAASRCPVHNAAGVRGGGPAGLPHVFYHCVGRCRRRGGGVLRGGRVVGFSCVSVRSRRLV